MRKNVSLALAAAFLIITVAGLPACGKKEPAAPAAAAVLSREKGAPS